MRHVIAIAFVVCLGTSAVLAQQPAQAATARDTKVVEIELAEAVANRLMGWAKLFGFFVGIPLAIIALWLGFLGYKTAADLKKLSERIDKLSADLGKAEHELKTRQEQLANLKGLDAIQAELESLQQKVQRLEKISFSGSGATEEVQKQIDAVLTPYQAYFKKLGWNFDSGKPSPTFLIDDNPIATTYYDGRKATMFVATKFIDDTDFTLRAYTHHVLAQARPGWIKNPLESGLALYFPCSFKDDPRFIGRSPYSGDAKTVWFRLTSDRRLDVPGNENEEAEAWGTLFWSIRKALGAEIADPLIFSAWRTFKPKGDNLEGPFLTQLLQNAGENEATVRQTFAERGATF